MNILITNIFLDSRSGTETFVRDLALKLRALGHYPMIYSPRLGNIADEIKSVGIPVVSGLRNIPCKPDIIHGHHHLQVINALLYFRNVPGIFVCHDRLSKNDVPPLHNRIHFYVAVDYNCRQRLTNSDISEGRIKVIYNSVDTDRFLSRSPLPVHPKRALVFSNNASRSNYLKPIINTCKKLNIKLDIAGAASDTMSDCPEKILGQYDLVFAKARCAMEAMVTGAAVILCDYRGLGPLVTTGELEMLRAWNFGMRCLKHPIEEENIKRQINRYNADDAVMVSNYMRQKATLSSMAQDYLDLYNEALTVIVDKEPGSPNEFKGYLNSLIAQTEKCQRVISLYKTQQWKWNTQYYWKHFLQLLQEPKMIWKAIIRRCQSAVRNGIFQRGVIFESDSVDTFELREQIKNIDKMLIKISMAENMLLRFGNQ